MLKYTKRAVAVEGERIDDSSTLITWSLVTCSVAPNEPEYLSTSSVLKVNLMFKQLGPHRAQMFSH